jgi:hypothetical protein
MWCRVRWKYWKPGARSVLSWYAGARVSFNVATA